MTITDSGSGTATDGLITWDIGTVTANSAEQTITVKAATVNNTTSTVDVVTTAEAQSSEVDTDPSDNKASTYVICHHPSNT